MLTSYLIIFISLLSLYEILILLFINKRLAILSQLVLVLYFSILIAIYSSSILFIILFIYLNIYRILNILRGFKNNEYKKLIRTSVIKSSLRLNILILLISFISFNNIGQSFSIRSIFEAFIFFSIFVIIIFNLTTSKNIKKSKHIHKPIHYYDRDLPTVSVLIPARNETVNLEECLSSLLLSDYPKLEIIVLDDCSVSKHTSDIIKNYAHAGVRFLAGNVPSNDWLAKNYAYQQF